MAMVAAIGASLTIGIAPAQASAIDISAAPQMSFAAVAEPATTSAAALSKSVTAPEADAATAKAKSVKQVCKKAIKKCKKFALILRNHFNEVAALGRTHHHHHRQEVIDTQHISRPELVDCSTGFHLQPVQNACTFFNEEDRFFTVVGLQGEQNDGMSRYGLGDFEIVASTLG
jgi:hypothetical protein